MSEINIFVQGTDILETCHLKLPAEATTVTLRRQWPAEGLLFFAEDGESPLKEDAVLAECGQVHRFHVHRCRGIEVVLFFNGKERYGKFSPATTLARVKQWAACEFGIEPDDAAELVLQIPGGEVRPDPSTHLGALVTGEECSQKLDLVPQDRVNG